MDEKTKHYQQTCLQLGDEFLLQYLLCAHQGFRHHLILSRLFSMGHSLELYAKAALLNHNSTPARGHNAPDLLRQLNSALCLSDEEIAAGRKLFDKGVTNFDLGLYEQYKEALELYQAEYCLPDLKYYIGKDNSIIYPARVSLVPVNFRYLDLVHDIRSSVLSKDSYHDTTLNHAVATLGFEENPAYRIVQGNPGGETGV